MQHIDFLRVSIILCWTGVIFFCLKSTWIVWHKPNKATPIDVFIALFGGCAWMVIGFQVRWYIASADSFFYTGLCVFGIVLGGAIMLVLRNYQKQTYLSTNEVENYHELV